MTSVRGVAKYTGVLIGTVSNVVNDRTAVNPAIRRAVVEAIGALGCHPNAAARGLRTSRTHAIGLTVCGLCDPAHGAATMINADRVANEHGCALLVTDAGRSNGRGARGAEPA